MPLQYVNIILSDSEVSMMSHWSQSTNTQMYV